METELARVVDVVMARVSIIYILKRGQSFTVFILIFSKIYHRELLLNCIFLIGQALV